MCSCCPHCRPLSNGRSDEEKEHVNICKKVTSLQTFLRIAAEVRAQDGFQLQEAGRGGLGTPLGRGRSFLPPPRLPQLTAQDGVPDAPNRASIRKSGEKGGGAVPGTDSARGRGQGGGGPAECPDFGSRNTAPPLLCPLCTLLQCIVFVSFLNPNVKSNMQILNVRVTAFPLKIVQFALDLAGLPPPTTPQGVYIWGKCSRRELV